MPLTKDRVIGVETEYSLSYYPNPKDNKNISIPNLSYEFFQCVDGIQKSETLPDFFLWNGGRAYQDAGCRSEYSSPETKGVIDTVIYDKAGERIFYKVCEKLQERLREQGYIGQVKLHKNNSDSIGNSYGTHENYLFSREIEWDYFVMFALPFFVTRQIYAGAGFIHPRSLEFEMSDKARFITDIVTIATMTKRGIINSRDEPHAQHEYFRRYHHASGESNMCEYATALKVGMTSLVLALAEEDRLPFVHIDNPVNTIKEISKDWKFKNKYRVGDKSLYAYEIQRIFLDAIEKNYSKIGIAEHLGDAYLAEIIEQADYVLKSLANDPYELEGKIDWITKLELIVSRAKTNPLKDVGFKIHLEYHRIYPDGIFQILVKKKDERLPITRMCTDEQIEYAISHPPQNTRAKTRAEWIRRQDVQATDWEIMYIDGIKHISDDPRKLDFIIEPKVE